jgi:hypothetical protein
VSWDTMIWIAGVTAEALFVALLVWRHAYKRLPIFFVYIVWGLASDLTMYVLSTRMTQHYLWAYLVELSIDSVLQYCVLVEIAWSALRPFRAALPRRIVIGISLFILLAALAAWPFAGLQVTSHLQPESIFILHLQQTFAILRVLFFLALAGCSHFLSIGWRDRELQAATGLGIYSLVSLATAVAHSHLLVRSAHYHLFDQLSSISYICSLVYWLVSFALPEPPRHSLPPNIQQMMETITEHARSQRERIDKDRKQ